MRRHWIIYSKVIRLTEEKRAYLVSLLFRLLLSPIMEQHHHISLCLFLSQPVRYGLEHHMETHLLKVYEVVAEVVQPQAFVADVVSATAGTNMTMTTFATNQTMGQS